MDVQEFRLTASVIWLHCREVYLMIQQQEERQMLDSGLMVVLFF